MNLRSISSEIIADLNQAIGPTPAVRTKIANRLVKWLKDEARKRPMPDAVLQQHLDFTARRIREMTKSLTIEITAEGMKVTAVGMDQHMLNLLHFGSNWFDPCPQLNEMIAGELSR